MKKQTILQAGSELINKNSLRLRRRSAPRNDSVVRVRPCPDRRKLTSNLQWRTN